MKSGVGAGQSGERSGLGRVGLSEGTTHGHEVIERG